MSRDPVTGRRIRKDYDGSGCAKTVWKVVLNGKDYALKYARNDNQLPMELALSMVRNPLRKVMVPYIAWRHIKSTRNDNGCWALQPWATSIFKATGSCRDDSDKMFEFKQKTRSLCSDLHTDNVSMHRGRIKIIDAGCAENARYEGDRHYQVKVEDATENQRQSVSIGRPDAKQGMAVDFRHDFAAIERRMLAWKANDMRPVQQADFSAPAGRGMLGHRWDKVRRVDPGFIAWPEGWKNFGISPRKLWGDRLDLKALCIYDELQVPAEPGMLSLQNNVKPQPNPVGIDRAARKYGAPAPRNARW